MVVDFYAVWCGPCKAIAPHVEKMANDLPDVLFLKSDVDKGDAGSSRQVRAMPTFHLYVKSNKVAEVVGGDVNKLNALIAAERAKLPAPVAAFSGAGVTLGGSVASREAMRALRQAKLGAVSGGADTVAAPAGVERKVAASPTTAPVVASVVQQQQPAVLALLLDMGFDASLAAEAVRATSHSGAPADVDAAVAWIEQHQGSDAAAAADATMQVEDASAHASSSGTSSAPSSQPAVSTSASTESAATTLSAEDSAAIAIAQSELDAEGVAAGGAVGTGRKLTAEEVAALLAKRRAEKAVAEKESERVRELKRREDGRKTVEIAEELAAAQVGF